MDIKLTPVVSSNIAATGYDAGTKTLAVQFKSGTAIHYYQDVPPEVAEGLANAESVGRYFAQNVRGKFVDSPRAIPAQG